MSFSRLNGPVRMLCLCLLGLGTAASTSALFSGGRSEKRSHSYVAAAQRFHAPSVCPSTALHPSLPTALFPHRTTALHRTKRAMLSRTGLVLLVLTGIGYGVRALYDNTLCSLWAP